MIGSKCDYCTYINNLSLIERNILSKIFYWNLLVLFFTYTPDLTISLQYIFDIDKVKNFQTFLESVLTVNFFVKYLCQKGILRFSLFDGMMNLHVKLQISGVSEIFVANTAIIRFSALLFISIVKSLLQLIWFVTFNYMSQCMLGFIIF